MSLITSIVTEVAHVADPTLPYLVGGIAFAIFLLLGVVTWSFRDVASRQGPRAGSGGHDAHTTGH